MSYRDFSDEELIERLRAGENDITDYIMEKYNYTQLDVKNDLKTVLKKGFIPKTYRFYPHLMEGEGQFLALLQKNDGEVSHFKKNTKFFKSAELIDFCKKNLNVNIVTLAHSNSQYPN